MPLKVSTDLRHTESILYDGIVMIKRKTSSKYALFRIFQSVSGFIWLCVLASLIVVAVVFYSIKFANDGQTKAMGLIPEDHDISPIKRFLSVIFRNSAAVLLAKVSKP